VPRLLAVIFPLRTHSHSYCSHRLGTDVNYSYGGLEVPSRVADFDRACRNTDPGCRNPKYFAFKTTKYKNLLHCARPNQAAGMFLPLTSTLASTAPADSDSFVAISKDFALRQSNGKDFNRGCRNPKSFAFCGPHVQNIFDCNCERSKIGGRVRVAHEPDRPIESKGFCISGGGMQKDLARNVRASSSEREAVFSGPASKDSAG
jgi:hypothetical protein